jgi:RimJ/RimL family protein N-acetyltransferase
MNLNYSIILNPNITDSHAKDFGNLLKKQNKVEGPVYEKAERCKMICIVSSKNQAIAIGGIKPITKSDFSDAKADLLSWEQDFNWELGYIYTSPEFIKKGIASNIVRLLLDEYGLNNIMASTEISQNPGMVKILERNGFRHYGKPWKSKIHENYLGLFLKYK